MEDRWRRGMARALAPARYVAFRPGLPEWVVLGAQKAGTSFVRRSLDAHPHVRMATRWGRRGWAWSRSEEIHFFDVHYDRGPEWYAGHFAQPRWRRPLRAGEKSPRYLCDPRAPERMSRLLPGVRLVVLLRDPVERAYSHHRMSIRKGHESGTFEDRVAAELERWHAGLGARFESGRFDETDPTEWANPLARGVYAPQLRRWWKHFPRERFWIATTEQLSSAPEATHAELLAFLGLAPRTLGPSERSGSPHPPMAPEIREQLAAFYRPYNQDLYALLGRNLGWD